MRVGLIDRIERVVARGPGRGPWLLRINGVENGSGGEPAVRSVVVHTGFTAYAGLMIESGVVIRGVKVNYCNDGCLGRYAFPLEQ